MSETYIDEVGIERCDRCDEEPVECCCECSECGDSIHDCACEEGPS